jgi:hypothetical protein
MGLMMQPPAEDAVLGALRRCPGCGDWWPDDEDFYSPGARRCRACVYESTARRRDRVREAARRYRSRLAARA